MFTCGHVYHYELFKTYMLPELFSRFESLHPSLRATTTHKLICEEYREKKAVQMACPRCVYNALLHSQRGMQGRKELYEVVEHKDLTNVVGRDVAKITSSTISATMKASRSAKKKALSASEYAKYDLGFWE